jgi:uncharacterized membrane protein
MYNTYEFHNNLLPMKQAIIGVLIALFLSAQSSASAHTVIPAREFTVTGVVTVVQPLYVQVRVVQDAKTVNYRFIMRPQTKIEGTLVAGGSVSLTYRIIRYSGRVRKNIVTRITVLEKNIDQGPVVQVPLPPDAVPPGRYPY